MKIQGVKELDSAATLQHVVKNTKMQETETRKRIQRPNVKKVAYEVQQTIQEKIQKIAEAMDCYVSSIQRELKIQVHQKTGKIIVKVVSKEDGKTIREIPSEELLNLAARMEKLSGVLFDQNP